MIIFGFRAFGILIPFFLELKPGLRAWLEYQG